MKQLILFFVFLFPMISSAQEIEHSHSILHSFIENKGQWDKNVLFQSKFDGGNLWVQQKKFVFHLQDYSAMEDAHGNFNYKGDGKLKQTIVHLNFVGANEVTEIEKIVPTPQYFNYFLGNNPSKWASEVRGYSEAVMHNLYDGINLKLIEDELQLKYEFHVQPYTSHEQIVLNYSGQENIKIDAKGSLIITTELGQIIEEKPYAYQIKNGRIVDVECAFKISDDEVTFEIGEYDQTVELIIDPVLIFATYAGSRTDNFGMTATYGYDGTAYSGGMVYGNAYPTPDTLAFDINANFTLVDNPNYGITDVFISKYSSDGTDMIWTTFLGGGNNSQGTETAHSMICDQNNNLFVFGATSSVDFPIQGGYQSTHAGGTDSLDLYYNGVHFKNQGTDIYVAKISENGQNLMASTYFGGSLNDGVSYKENLSYNVGQGIYNNSNQYDSLTTNYGDQFRGEIMLDQDGNCVIASCTRSNDFPVQNAFQSNNAGMQDGVVFKLSSDLSNLHWSSYYGGSNNDGCYSLKIDSSYNVVFSGGTSSNDLTGTLSGWQPTYGGGSTDGFVVKLMPDGSAITAASYIGTPNYDQTFFVEVDRENNVFLLGQSRGGTFPVLNAGFVNPNSSQFVIKLDSTLSTNLNSTTFGNGSSNINISPAAFLVDICGNIYISGWGASILQSTELVDMPVFNPNPSDPNQFYQPTSPNGFDFYLLVIERELEDILYGTYIGGDHAQEHVDGGTSRFDKNGVVYQSVCGGCRTYDPITETVHSWSDFPTYPAAVWSDTNLSDNCNNLVFKLDFQLIPNAVFLVDNNIGCAPFTVTFDNLSALSDSYLWDFGNGTTTSEIFEPTVTFDTPGVYEVYLYVTDSICLITDTAQVTITVLPELDISTTPDVYSCIPSEVNLTAFSNGQGTQFIWSEDPMFSDTLNTDVTDSVLVITPPNSTVYYVLVQNEYCSVMDSVLVNYTSSDLMLSINDSICIGDQTTAFVTNLNPFISFEYLWSPDSIIVGSSVNASVNILPQISQYIYLNAEASNGCSLLDSIYIHVGDVPEDLVNATASEYVIPEGGEVTLSGEPDGFSYQWIFPETVDAPNSQNTTATLTQSTLFTFVVTDGICTRSDTVFVTTYPYVCEDPYVFVPNAFTPNFDGENDVLFVQGAMIEKMLFRIFDRWGALVFESESRHFGWDGTYKGKPLDPDVYDYYLEVDCIGGQNAIIKGNITLMK